MPTPPYPDLIEGLIQFLQADAVVAEMTSTGGGVFDTEIPTNEDIKMPTGVIVVDPHGGPAKYIQLALNESRVNVICFHATPHLAHVLYVAAYEALKEFTSSVWASTYILAIKPSTGPITGRDTMLQWPFCASSWIVTASDADP